MRATGWRRSSGIVMAGLLAAAIALVVVVAPRASGAGSLRLVIPPTGQVVAVQDLDGHGLSLGDRLAGRGPLRDGAGHRAGRAFLECVVMKRIVSDDQGLYRCTYTLRLSDGDLVLQGLDPRGAGTSAFAVLGGTGDYAAARGAARVTDSNAGTTFRIDLID